MRTLVPTTPTGILTSPTAPPFVRLEEAPQFLLLLLIEVPLALPPTRTRGLLPDRRVVLGLMVNLRVLLRLLELLGEEGGALRVGELREGRPG